MATIATQPRTLPTTTATIHNFEVSLVVPDTSVVRSTHCRTPKEPWPSAGAAPGRTRAGGGAPSRHNRGAPPPPPV